MSRLRENAVEANLHGCTYGLRCHKTKLLIYKPWRIISTHPETWKLSRKCQGNRVHAQPCGDALAATSSYPAALCSAVAKLMLEQASAKYIWSLAMDRQQTLAAVLLDAMYYCNQKQHSKEQRKYVSHIGGHIMDYLNSELRCRAGIVEAVEEV